MSSDIVAINLRDIEREIKGYDAHIAFLQKSLDDNPTAAKRTYLAELKAEQESLRLFLKMHHRFNSGTLYILIKE